MFYNGNKQHLYYQYINKKYNSMKEKNGIYEVCIICQKETETLKSTHIDFRYGYVEGAGQMCRECYLRENRNLITINSRTILDTPNDSELGAKVRQMYWDSKK
jgi:hypothetical protein